MSVDELRALHAELCTGLENDQDPPSPASRSIVTSERDWLEDPGDGLTPAWVRWYQ